jgi:hypothetical protein
MNPFSVEAYSPGTCPLCHCRYSATDRIAKVPQGWVHVACAKKAGHIIAGGNA